MALENATPTTYTPNIYNPTTWATGDVITAEKLNHMEDGITSTQVYSVSEQVRFSGSVTTEQDGEVYYTEIDCNLSDAPEQIKVTFDGTEYTCEKVGNNPSFGYGGLDATLGDDFSEYPFAVVVQGSDVFIDTETVSTHQVEIAVVSKTVNQDLTDAIPVMRLIHGVTNSADALTAFNAGRLLYFTYQGGFYIVTGIDQTNNIFIITPSDGTVACHFSGTKISIGQK